MAEQFVHDDRFIESFSNRKHVVFGRVLLPYSLWHHFNLERIQSPILLGGDLTPLTLWQAVQVCSTPWNRAHYVPDTQVPGMLRFLWEAGRYNFLAEVRKFEAYFNDYNAWPKLWPNHHKSFEESAEPVAERDFDENLEVALYVMKTSSLTWSEIWTMPLGMLRWTFIGLQKLDGAKLDIWTPEHEAMFQEHKRKREAKIDERGKEIAAETGMPYEQARKQAHDEHWAKVKSNYGQQSKQPPR